MDENIKLPLVSVVMPAYNCQQYIAQAIQSVLNQSYQNIELLIADDASIDSTKKIIEKHLTDKRIRFFSHNINQGYLKTWNELMKFTKGDFITFQDADDYSDTNRISILYNFLQQNTDIGVVGSNYFRVNDLGELDTPSEFELKHEEIFAQMPDKYNFVGSALMLRRAVYQTIGGYHEFFNRMGGEDLYWCFLIAEKYRIQNIKEPLYFYRFNPKSVSGDLSNNPSKLNVGFILKYLINDRKTRKTDDLQESNIERLQGKLNTLNRPFIEDNSYYYYYVAKRRFYEGHKKMALKLMLKAIMKRPLKISYYKDLYYFITTNSNP